MGPITQVVLDADQLNDADRSILDELQHGRASPSYLADQTGIEQTYINQRLRRLDEHGHVENLARGLWELTDDPRRDQPKTGDIRRGEQLGGPPAAEKIDHCLTNIEQSGFSDGIDWQTELAPSVTVEEIVGALVHAEQALQLDNGGNDE